MNNGRSAGRFAIAMVFVAFLLIAGGCGAYGAGSSPPSESPRLASGGEGESAADAESDYVPEIRKLSSDEARAMAVEDFGRMSDVYRRHLLGAVDEETYQAIVDEYGLEEVEKYRG